MPRHSISASLFGIRGKDLDDKSFPLSQAPNQKPLKVVQIRGDGTLCARIAAMGIQLGAVMKVRRIGPASCLARVSRSRHIISLDGKVAERIWVTNK